MFAEGNDAPAAVGGYTHVFVDAKSRKSAPMDLRTKNGLVKLLASPATEADTTVDRSKL